MKRILGTVVLTWLMSVACVTNALALGSAPSTLVPEQSARAAGLTRAWFAQAMVERGREVVTSVTVQDGLLLLTTDKGVLQVFDAETGVSLWRVDVGDSYLFAPAVNSKVVVAICGTQLNVYDRANGAMIVSTQLYGQPASSPLASEREIYVPTFAQRVLAYPLTPVKDDGSLLKSTVETMQKVVESDPSLTADLNTRVATKYVEKDRGFKVESLDSIRPYSCTSFGVSMVPPILGTQDAEHDMVGWTTDQGWLLIGSMDRTTTDAPFKLFYKLQSRPNFAYVGESRVYNTAMIPRDDVEATPFFVEKDLSKQCMAQAESDRVGGLFLIGSRSGHVFAMNDVNGKLRWTYLTETPTSNRIAAFDDKAYIPTENGDYFAVTLFNGEEVWKAIDVQQTVAASEKCVYVVDNLNRLAALNMQTGQRLHTLDVGNVQRFVFNGETDRIYLVSDDGLVQCLREIDQTTPVIRREPLSAVRARLFAGAEKDVDDADADAKAGQGVDEDEDEDFGGANAGQSASAFDDDEEDDVFGGLDDQDDDDDDDAFGGEDDDEDPFGSDDF
ncbi:MAG: PQQ-binding-like beta-propeller repeat protein [Planctomycetia bacterium]|nr:PQQ-binding-like beta-propeller repeat protein [Planctomycetia bacterium]